MINALLVFILLAIPSGILFYLRRERKKGAVCIGCPHGRQCVNCSGTCSSKQS